MAKGEVMSPKLTATISTAVPDTAARVALHMTSPATMSSGCNGVNSTAS